MFTKLKDFKSIRKSMHLSSNDDEELPGKQGKRLKGTASLPNKKNKGKGSELPAADSDNRVEDAAVGQDGNEMDRPQKQKKSKGKRTQLPASDSDVEPDNRYEDAAVGQDGSWIKHPKKQKKNKEKRSQMPASDSDVEPYNQTEDAGAGQQGNWIEHPQKQQPSTQHPQHHDFVTSSSEGSVPLSSSTQISSPSSARQSPLRRSFKTMKQALIRSPTRNAESPKPYLESQVPLQDYPSDPQTYDRFQPVMPGKFPNVRQLPGAKTVISTDPQGPPPALGAPSPPSPVTREVTAGQGPKPSTKQAAGQQPHTGQGKRRPPPGTGSFNPSKHRHTWPCEMIPINVPSPENAQAILHPRKDVFVLKVAKVSASGDRRIKMELELVTPKYGKKLPSRLDTREAQCDPECCCPCACCPKPKKKKKC